MQKTEFMTVSGEKHPEGVLQINSAHIKRVSAFKYLGAMLNKKCDDDEEVHIKVGHAKSTYGKLRTYLACRKVLMDLKMKMIKCYIWLVLLYLWCGNLVIEDQVD